MFVFEPVIAMFQRGGLVMWPILLFSLYAVGLIVERWLHYRDQTRLLNEFWTQLQAMDIQQIYCNVLGRRHG